jgi:hypothetical protein
MAAAGGQACLQLWRIRPLGRAYSRHTHHMAAAVDCRPQSARPKEHHHAHAPKAASITPKMGMTGAMVRGVTG